MTILALTDSDEKRFWSKVAKTGTCWTWLANKSTKGYGRFFLDGAARTAHRLSYEWANGPIPEGMQVDHLCHQRDCVNPTHLRLATQKQNQEHRAGAQKNSGSGVRGVWLDKARNKWIAKIQHNGQKVHLGRFATVAEAESVVMAKRNELFTHNNLDRSGV